MHRTIKFRGEKLERGPIPLRFLMAAPAGDTSEYNKRHVTKWTRIAPVAKGARKPRMANRGDAPTTSHAANYTGRIVGNSQHDAVRRMALKGY